MNAKQIFLMLLTLITYTNAQSMEQELPQGSVQERNEASSTSSLRRAIVRWEIDNVRSLIDQGTSLATPPGRRPLLHLAIASNSRHMRTDIIHLLLDKGVDVNEKNEQSEWIDDEVPLGLAIRCNAVNLIPLLLAHQNINVNAQNNVHQTPLDLVMERKSQYRNDLFITQECNAIIELLTKHGAKRSADL